MGEHVRAGDLDIWTEQVGQGPDVLLIGGAGRHRGVVAVPARRPRRPLPADRLRQPGRGPHRHAWGFGVRGGDGRRRRPGPASAGGSLGPCGRVLGGQHRRPGAGPAPSRAGPQPGPAEHLAGDGPLLSLLARFCPLAGRGRPQRTRVPGGVLTWTSTPPGRTTTAPSPSSSRRCSPSRTSRRPRTCRRYLDAFLDHDTTDRLPQITAPTLVLAGGRDSTARPPLGRAVAELIPGARFEVMDEEAHQPFQEIPEEWNARVDAFWRQLEGRGDP